MLPEIAEEDDGRQMAVQSVAAAAAPVRVRAVASAADWRRFLALAQRVNAADPAWVAPLNFMRRQQWNPSRPWFEHGRARAWLAWRDEQPVGCISAQIDQLHEATWGEPLGYFGQLEAFDDQAIFSALVDAAASWLAEQGMVTMRGPYDLSVNQSCGLLVEGFEFPPMLLMGHVQPYYGPRVEGAGLEPVMDLLAYRTEPSRPAPAIVQRLLRRAGSRLRVRPLDMRRFAGEMELLRDIFNDAWSRNWGFVPFTCREFLQLGKDIRPLLRPGYIQLAELDGEPAAFIVVLPNFNEYLAGLQGRLLPFGWLRLLWRLRRRATSARVPLMGVRRAWQGSAMGSVLAFAVIEAVRPRLLEDGVEMLELSWILESNKGMRSILDTVHASEYKRYRIYERALS